MTQQFNNFTRGSQLLGHFGFMFAAGMRGPFWIAVLTIVGLISYNVSTGLTDHEQYLCLMRLEAMAYSWLEFDPTKLVAIETASGMRVTMPWSSVTSYFPVALAWIRFSAAVTSGATVAAFALGPALALYWWIAQRFGRSAKMRRHERGARLVDLAELKEDIKARNAPKRAEDYAKIFGPTWRTKTMLATTAELDRAGIYRPYHFAGVTYPWRLEQSHAMLIGTTGTGKTVELSALVDQIRARDHRAVIFDLTGGFIERFYDDSRDIILNPLDARCPQWSIFAECDSESEFTTAWEALIPHDGGTSEPFWVQAARMLGVETSMKLKREGRGTNHALYTELMTADLKHVHKLVQDTIADPITAPEAARMAESVRAVLNTNAKALRLLPRTGPLFSVKQWMRGDSRRGSILFLSARYVDMSVTRIMLTTWMDTALNTLMTMKRSRDVRMWFLVDELGSLHRLAALEKGLQTARNYGGAIVLGVHAFAKLKETYGQNGAETLASLARTKLVLATADRQTATWSSDFIGHRQFKEMEEGFSYGYSSVRDAVTLTQRRNLEPLVLPDEIMDLPSLSGFLKYPEGFPAARVTLRIVDYPVIAHGFVQRPPERDVIWRDGGPIVPPPPPETPGGEGSSDGGTGLAIMAPERSPVNAQPQVGSSSDEPVPEPEAAQGSLPLNPILVPIDRLKSEGATPVTIGAKRPQGDGQAEPSELQGLRPRKLPDPAVGENAGRDPLHPQLRSPSAPHQIEKELKMAFPERDEGAGTGVDEDLGIDD